MAIVSSTHTVEPAQVDGRCYVVEDHVDQIGKHYFVNYLAAVGENYAAVLSERAIQLSAWLIANEIALALQADANPVLVYATKNNFVPVLREAYKQSIRSECARLANWILNRIAQGWVTDVQVQTAFGLTAGQWTTLKSQMATWQADYLAIQGAVGQ